MLGAKGIRTPFDVQADSAPIVYVHDQPARTSSSVRALERTAARLTAPDLATGKTVPVTNYLADPVEMKLLHMMPTMMELLRLHDDYTPDGRVLTEVLAPSALPRAMQIHTRLLIELGDAYSQINAAVGEFGLETLKASTKALASESTGDATYTRIEGKLVKLGIERDAIVAQMKTELYGAAFGGRPLNIAAAEGLIKSADGLLCQAAALL